MTDRRVSVIVVTYNSRSVIGQCLEPLIADTLNDVEIIVVDNASSDGTQALIKTDFPQVLFIQNDENLGFAKAVNIGARLASGSHIVLLNPDAVISGDALHQLVAIQTEHPRPSIVAPLISQPDGRLRIVSAGRFPSPWRMFTHFSGLSRLGRNAIFEGHYLLPGRLKALESTDWVTGAVLAITKRDWVELHGLSERWFMYAEDIDLCWRARERGMDVLLSCDVHATHLVGASTTDPRSRKADWIVNLLDFYRTSMRGGTFGAVIWKAVVCSGLASRAVVYRVVAMRQTTTEARIHWNQEGDRFASFAFSLLKS